MIKKLISLFLFLFFFSILQNSRCWAAENPGDKLSRGVVNIISAPLEIAKQVNKEWKAQPDKTKKVSFGIFNGLLKGVGYTVGRIGSGVWDVVTCPFKTPGNYEPLMKPDYVFDEKTKGETQEQINKEVNPQAP